MTQTDNQVSSRTKTLENNVSSFLNGVNITGANAGDSDGHRFTGDCQSDCFFSR